MLVNNLKIALRYLFKTRFFTLLNIVGLSAGMVTCLLIFHHVHYETGFDKYHDNVEQIYRLRYERTSSDGSAVRFASCCPPGGPWARENYPQIETIARLYQHKAVVSHEQLLFSEEYMYFAEPEIFKVLTIPFIDGDPATALTQPNTAVISQSTALRYFGSEQAVGKSFRVNRDQNYLVTGVYRDFPENSHIRCDIMLAYADLITLRGEELQQAWGYTGFYTYLRLRPGTDAAALESQMNASVGELLKEWLDQYGVTVYLKLQPIRDIHLTSHYLQELKTNGDADTVKILSIIAVFIILMAWINYINLSTARAASRARQVGIRKVIGASRVQLSIQFLLETIIVNLLSVVTALGLLLLFLPAFYRFTGMPAGYPMFSQPWFWLALAGLFIGGVLLSGGYPVLLVSSFRPEKVLKGGTQGAGKGPGLRKGLLLAQFVIALLLITGTFAIVRQIRFMRNQKLGFKMDQTLVVKVPRVVNSDNKESLFDTFKSRVRGLSGIRNAAYVTEVPGRQFYWDNGGIRRKGADASEDKNYMIVGVDYDFIDMFGLELVAGRSFSREFPADKDALMLNEKAVAWLGFASPQDAIGKEVDYWEKIYPVIGVLKNYHQQTVKEDFEPQIFRYYPTASFGVFAIQLNGSSIRQSVDQVHELWSEFFPGNPFDYYFLDEYYDQQYHADEMFGKTIGLFSVLSVLVTCLGILGLSAFSAMQRTKEVGIRKVLGANVPGIVYLFAREFLLLLGTAFVIALPIALYGIHLWLLDFVQKMNMNIGLFLLPLVIVWFITLLTVASQAFRVANSNPIDALRYE